MFISFNEERTGAPITVNSDYIVKIIGPYEWTNWHQFKPSLSIYRWRTNDSGYDVYSLTESDYNRIINLLDK